MVFSDIKKNMTVINIMYNLKIPSRHIYKTNNVAIPNKENIIPSKIFFTNTDIFKLLLLLLISLNLLIVKFEDKLNESNKRNRVFFSEKIKLSEDLYIQPNKVPDKTANITELNISDVVKNFI